MSLKKRLAFFGIGLVIGIIFVKLIFGKKDVSFDYLPNDRVLKTLRTKQRIFDKEALLFFNERAIDTSAIEKFLTQGDVNFSESRQREKPCNFYQIEKQIDTEVYAVYLKNCDTLVTVQKAYKINAK